MLLQPSLSVAHCSFFKNQLSRAQFPCFHRVLWRRAISGLETSPPLPSLSPPHHYYSQLIQIRLVKLQYKGFPLVSLNYIKPQQTTVVSLSLPFMLVHTADAQLKRRLRSSSILRTIKKLPFLIFSYSYLILDNLFKLSLYLLQLFILPITKQN